MESTGFEESIEMQKLERDIQDSQTLEQLINALHQESVILDSKGLQETDSLIEGIEEIFGDVKLAKFEGRDIGPIAQLPKLESIPELHGIRGKVVELLQQVYASQEVWKRA